MQKYKESVKETEIRIGYDVIRGQIKWLKLFLKWQYAYLMKTSFEIFRPVGVCSLCVISEELLI